MYCKNDEVLLLVVKKARVSTITYSDVFSSYPPPPFLVYLQCFYFKQSLHHSMLERCILGNCLDLLIFVLQWKFIHCINKTE